VEWPLSKCPSCDGETCLVRGILRLSIDQQAYKHIFTSPSSVDREPKATRSGNARIHGMTQVTPASIAYVATQVSADAMLCRLITFVMYGQVRFALTSSPVFSRTDTVTDSERFYSSILELTDDEDEQEEVRDLLSWWNRYVRFALP
jgi:hypothetical protein